LRIDGDSSDAFFVCLVLLLGCRGSIHVYRLGSLFFGVFGGHWNFMIWNGKRRLPRDASILPGDVSLLYVLLGYQDLAQCVDGPWLCHLSESLE